MDVKLGIIAGGIVAALSAPAFGQQAPEPPTEPTPSDGIFTADLFPMNNSGVNGTAYIAKEGEELTVIMEVKGLEPGVEHPQHIHGLSDSETAAGCPTLAEDQNGDNLVDLEEGVPAYGNVILPLEPFPTPEGDAPVSFSESYELDAETAPNLQQLSTRTIVLHGLTVQGTFNPTHPVACGEIRPLSRMQEEEDEDDMPQ